ncbi:MAG TPA: hypothetical protein VHN99_09865 [Deinococcales bacterium]|nr:hypothetical protein [Deinococcales bacterium]
MPDDPRLTPLFEALADEGFRPRRLEDGAFVISAFSTDLLVMLDPQDPEFLVVRSWHELDDVNPEAAEHAANTVNSDVKVAKAGLEDGQLVLSAEFMFGSLEDALQSVSRAPRALDHALRTFRRALKPPQSVPPTVSA